MGCFAQACQNARVATEQPLPAARRFDYAHGPRYGRFRAVPRRSFRLGLRIRDSELSRWRPLNKPARCPGAIQKGHLSGRIMKRKGQTELSKTREKRSNRIKMTVALIRCRCRFAHKDRDIPARACPEVGIGRVVLVADGPEVRLFVGGGNAGVECQVSAAMTDLDVGGLHEVEIPGGVARRAALRGDQECAVPVGDVHHRKGYGAGGSGAFHGDEADVVAVEGVEEAAEGQAVEEDVEAREEFELPAFHGGWDYRIGVVDRHVWYRGQAPFKKGAWPLS